MSSAAPALQAARRRGARARWTLYVLRMRGGALYTGISTDVERRLAEHSDGRGARALRGRAPLELVYRCALGAAGLALRAERRFKRLPRARKLELVAARPARARLLRLLELAAPRAAAPRAQAGSTPRRAR